MKLCESCDKKIPDDGIASSYDPELLVGEACEHCDEKKTLLSILK